MQDSVFAEVFETRHEVEEELSCLMQRQLLSWRTLQQGRQRTSTHVLTHNVELLLRFYREMRVDGDHVLVIQGFDDSNLSLDRCLSSRHSAKCLLGEDLDSYHLLGFGVNALLHLAVGTFISIEA